MFKYKKAYILALALLCCVLLVGCTPKVVLSSGEFEADITELTTVVLPEDMAKLDKFKALEAVDFSGSSCYEEITAWADAHPTVNVKYTVELADGKTADNTVASLDLSSCTEAEILSDCEVFVFLPELKSVSFGDGKLSPDTFFDISSRFPEIDFNGGFLIDGQLADLNVSELDLTGISSETAQQYISLMPYMTNLKSIELGSDENSQITWEDIAAIQAACPNAEVNYKFVLYNKRFTLNSTSMILSHKPIDDNGALVMRVLACMPKLTYLDMDTCGVDDEGMAAIRDAYPNVKVVWRIWFGKYYSVRTDVEKILASNPDAAGELDHTNTGSLKYCTDLKYLDVGHNVFLDDISFVSYMPNLEVVIIAMVSVTDFSPLGDCPKLEYMELGASGLHDLSFCANLKELRHLSVASCPCLFDISPLYNLPDLERFWVSPYTPVSQDQLDKLKECAPNCEINTWSRANGDLEPGKPGWRYTERVNGRSIIHPRYALLWEQFDYGGVPYSYSYASNDPLYYGSSEPY